MADTNEHFFLHYYATCVFLKKQGKATLVQRIVADSDIMCYEYDSTVVINIVLPDKWMSYKEASAWLERWAVKELGFAHFVNQGYVELLQGYLDVFPQEEIVAYYESHKGSP